MRIRIPLIIAIIGLTTISCTTNSSRKPVLYTVGDSTVKNGQGDGAGGLWGWGDFIHQFVDTTKITVKNHALGGTSSRTFQKLGLWDSVYQNLNEGDFVLIQFGHNDDGPINDNFRARGTIKGIGDESEVIDNMLTGERDTVHTYGWYIRKIIKDAHHVGAIPLVISPIPRNKWSNKQVERNNDSYGLWAQQVALEERAAFIDLNEAMASKMEDIGQIGVTGNYFYEKDHTHTSARGAVLAASLIVNEVRNHQNDLSDFLIDYPQIKLPKKKNLFLVGDSTMADNNNENAVGWGVPFAQFIDTTRLNIYNRALGGRSSRTFINEGHWDKVLDELQPEDYVLIQFGHNDAGAVDKEKYRGSLDGTGFETLQIIKGDTVQETVHTFGQNIRQMVLQAKEKGGQPILLSLTPRNEWPNGEVEQRKDTYIKWTQEVAESEKVPFIDLSNKIALFYEKVGRDSVATFFPKDHTHTNIHGASLNAKIAAKTLKNQKQSAIRDYITVPQL
ncbi:rhamnogalacturonan acetylesterase [Cytophaga sp. FL35]|uniref:rhamnogalacturonan acetylesterase n=1 Tax=Cytophaga sp. FL35 TaxID=1904456 RepID=UPI001653BFE1|nr:rhamnogalacturonan acetylesterase [Cytophaga sp. FL35]MBC7000575.1 rhamnogalacturonan acetylesterase [Cytophaga sp. FL35]